MLGKFKLHRAGSIANRIGDARSIKELRRMGWGVVAVWECETRRDRLDTLAIRLQRFLGQ
jgi:G:T-mismatch repair DNA endonuclease (very short patch repair protein)